MKSLMPSFQDSAVIFFIALLLFGPKKLPELARQLGKLMGEFRRASNEFRMQMEDELRISEQAEKQKQIEAIEAAAPVHPLLVGSASNTIAAPAIAPSAEDASTLETASSTESLDVIEDPLDSHPHTRPPDRYTSSKAAEPAAEPPAPLPIASSGDLNLMPPATGLPVARSSSSPESTVLSPMFDAIPQAPDRSPAAYSDHSAGAPAAPDEAMSRG